MAPFERSWSAWSSSCALARAKDRRATVEKYLEKELPAKVLKPALAHAIHHLIHDDAKGTERARLAIQAALAGRVRPASLGSASRPVARPSASGPRDAPRRWGWIG